MTPDNILSITYLSVFADILEGNTLFYETKMLLIALQVLLHC